MSPYRQAVQTHKGLESPCRRCGAVGCLYLYFPICVPAGPLCHDCFVTWRGKSVRMRFGTIGVGMYAWPVEDDGGLDAKYLHDNVIDVEGPRPDEQPLERPPLPPSWWDQTLAVVWEVVRHHTRL
jgi:hypothetical protein